MGIFVSKAEVRKSLLNTLQTMGESPVLLHTDILRIGILDRMKSRAEMLADHAEVLLEAMSDRTFLIPSFNYDFCRTERFEPKVDPVQVGQLNEFLRRSGLERTHTPVFNFCIANNCGFRCSEAENPFGEESTFAQLVEADAWIGFYGANFQYNTFIHAVEESLPIGYRYLKEFRGQIIEGSTSRPISLQYRVRPMIEGAVDYDWLRLEADLRERGILRSVAIGNGQLLYYRARELHHYWYSAISSDEFFLLTPKSREVSLSLFDDYGRPLAYEHLEVAR